MILFALLLAAVPVVNGACEQKTVSFSRPWSESTPMTVSVHHAVVGDVAIEVDAGRTTVDVTVDVSADDGALLMSIADQIAITLGSNSLSVTVPRLDTLTTAGAPVAALSGACAVVALAAAAEKRVGAVLAVSLAARYAFVSADEHSCLKAKVTVFLPASFVVSKVSVSLTSGLLFCSAALADQCNKSQDGPTGAPSPPRDPGAPVVTVAECSKNEKFAGAKELPGIELASGGMNIITLQRLNRAIFDLDVFTAACETKFSQQLNQDFRIPEAVDTWTFRTAGVAGFQATSFESAVDFARSQSDKLMQSVEVSVSGMAPLIKAIVDVEASLRVAGSKSAETQFAISQSTTSRTRLFRAETMTTVGEFSIATTAMRLSKTFINRVNVLPSAFDFAAYKAFISEYGTHFYASGTLGGRFSWVYSFDRMTLADTVANQKDQEDCLEIEGSASIGVTAFGSASVSSAYAKCKAVTMADSSAQSFSQLRTDVKGFVEGGLSNAVGRLQAGIAFSSSNPSQLEADHRRWVATVAANPDLLTFKLRGIEDVLDAALLHPSSATAINDLAAKRTNLIRALQQYFQEETPLGWSPSSCPACNTGITPTFEIVPPATNPSCACKCVEGVKYACVGKACVCRQAYLSCLKKAAVAEPVVCGRTLALLPAMIRDCEQTACTASPSVCNKAAARKRTVDSEVDVHEEAKENGNVPLVVEKRQAAFECYHFDVRSIVPNVQDKLACLRMSNGADCVSAAACSSGTTCARYDWVRSDGSAVSSYLCDSGCRVRTTMSNFTNIDCCSTPLCNKPCFANTMCKNAFDACMM